MSFKTVAADHKDLIHDVAFNFHGTRMATCSTDQQVKIWDVGDDGEWYCSANLKTHCGSVWKLTWAHPEFGQVLATCSFDRTCAIWEETVSGAGGGGGGGAARHLAWVRRSNLADSRTSVMDIEFSPNHLGFRVATCSADGVVRIYEAPDVVNLSQWSLQHEFNCKISCSCLSWSRSRFHEPLIAVGSDDPNPGVIGKVFIYEYHQSGWVRIHTVLVSDPVHSLAFAPSVGRSYHMLAIASKDIKIIVLKPKPRKLMDDAVVSPAAVSSTSNIIYDMRQAAEFDEHSSQVWRVSWNILGTILASAGDDGTVRLWKSNYLEKWRCVGQCKSDSSTLQAHTLGSSSNMQHQQQPATTMNMQPGATSQEENGDVPFLRVGPLSNPGQVVWH